MQRDPGSLNLSDMRCRVVRSRQRINAWRMLTCGIPTMIGPASDSGMRSLSMLRHRAESSRSYRSTDRLRYANVDELKRYGANLTFLRFHAGNHRCCELSDTGNLNYTTTAGQILTKVFPSQRWSRLCLVRSGHKRASPKLVWGL